MTTTKTKSTKRHKRQPAASPSRINERQRRAQALELRIQGKNFQTIADELGFSDKSGAYRAVMAELNEAPAANADELRTQQAARLDALLDAEWPYLTDKEHVHRAVEKILRIEERRAKLMGIDLDPKASEMLQAALAAASASATANVFIINGEKKRPEDLTFEELDIVEAHLVEADGE